MEYGINIETTVKGLSKILTDLRSGLIQIPTFQRDFVWDREQIKELFDSIQKNYPIGSILLWRPDKPFATEDVKQVGPYTLPQEVRQKCYLLDGCQRLSTLVGCLTNPNKSGLKIDMEMYNMFFNLHYDLKEESFFYPQRSDTAPWQVPVFVLMSTSEFRQYTRLNMESAMPADELFQCLDRADAFSRVLLDYKLAVTEINGANLKEAVNIFSRINSKGTDISTDWMASALAYGQGFDLSKELDCVTDKLTEYHFEEIGRLQLFRCYQSGFGKLYFDQSDIEALAAKKDFQETVKVVSTAIQNAVRFLHVDLGVPDYRLLPYNMQLIFLTLFFKEVPHPSARQIKDLERWFWETSYSNYFSEYTLSNQRKAYGRFMDYAHGVEGDILYTDDNEPLQAYPFPSAHSLLSARSKALVLFMMRHARGYGENFDAGYCFKKFDETSDKSPANMWVSPESLRSGTPNPALWSRDKKDAYLMPTDYGSPGWPAEREQLIRQAERQFVESLGMEYV